MRSQIVGSFAEDVLAIAVFRNALVDALAFSHRYNDREVGGFLLGANYVTDRTIVEVRHFLPARNARSGVASLTFTHDTWSELHRTLEESHPSEQIVGWHHTHPAMGVFLSSQDLFIHRHFFSEPWQVALVVDPRRGELAFFQWNLGQIVDSGFALVER